MPNSPAKKRRKIEAVSKSYPEVYQERFPTPESEALLFPEKPKAKPQLLMWALKTPSNHFKELEVFGCNTWIETCCCCCFE